MASITEADEGQRKFLNFKFFFFNLTSISKYRYRSQNSDFFFFNVFFTVALIFFCKLSTTFNKPNKHIWILAGSCHDKWLVIRIKMFCSLTVEFIKRVKRPMSKHYQLLYLIQKYTCICTVLNSSQNASHVKVTKQRKWINTLLQVVDIHTQKQALIRKCFKTAWCKGRIKTETTHDI